MDAGKNLLVGNGTNLSVQARVEVADFSSLGVQVVNVFVPTTEATFELVGGQLDFNLSDHEVNVSSPGWNGSSILQTSIVLPNTTFNASVPAILTSSMVAVMTQLPWGSVSLNVSWRWELSPPGTAASWSEWSGGQTVVPDQYLAESSTSPPTMIPGAPFSVCVAGAIGGRTLSLHVETPDPYFDFDQVNATIPQLTTGPYCWSVPIPTNNPNTNLPWVTPASLVVHIWDYQNFPGPHLTTLLLYVIPVTLVHAYAVTLREKGLPAGTSWNTTIGGVTKLSRTTSVRFDEPNGSYAFQIGGVPGWTTKFTGSVEVNGSNVGVFRAFTPKTYTVTFRETGLPVGTNWSVTIDGTRAYSLLGNIKFHLPNGSYSYTVANVTNHSRTPNGSVSVDGTGALVWVHFSLGKHSGAAFATILPASVTGRNGLPPFDAVAVLYRSPTWND
jgi:hypothetical protein